jgi:hypothetical protein
MSLEYKVVTGPDHLLISLSGRYESSDAPIASTQIIEACEKHQATKALIDVRSIEGSMSTMDRFYLGSIFSMKYIKERVTGKIPPCRFAMVGHEPLVDPNRFGETVATNRGLAVKVFLKMEEAIAWLKTEPGEKN